MVFLNGWMLALGIAAMAVPIVLHLMARNRPKPTPFPSIRLLSQTIVTNRRRVRLKQWILLALRAACLAWLGLALAHPSVAAATSGRWGQAALWAFFGIAGFAFASAVALSKEQRSRGWLIAGLALGSVCTLVAAILGLNAWLAGRSTPLQGGQGPVSALLLFDVAPRMEYQFDGQTRLQRAQELGDSILSEFPEGSRAAIVDSTNATPFFAVDLAAARRQIENLRTRYLHQTLTRRLAQSLELFNEPSELPREIYVFTDRNQQAWPQGPELQALKERLIRDEVRLYVIDVRAERNENLWLSTPRLTRESITSPGTLELEIDLFNQGTAKSVTVELELEQPDAARPSYRDGEVLVPERTWTRATTVELAADGSSAVALAIPDLPLGVHQGRVRLSPSDPLAWDNTRYFTIEVRPPWRSLVFAAPETRSSVLIEAISPSVERLAGRSVFEFQTATYEDFGKHRLSDFDAVYLLDPGPLDPATWTLLADYCQAGGSLALFMGARAEMADAQGLGFRQVDPSFTTPEARQVLPGQPTHVWNSTAGGVLFSPRDFAHPLLASLRGLETSLPWNEFPVVQHWGWEFPASELSEQANADASGTAPLETGQQAPREPRIEIKPGPAAVVIGLSDGTPAVIQAPVGAGQVIVWTTPIGESVGASSPDRWNQLTVGSCWPYFLLVNQLALTMVTEESSRLNLDVGETAGVVWRGETAPEVLTFYSPLGGEPERLRGERGRWLIRFTESPGAYRFKGGTDEIRTLGFAVNAASAESDLTAREASWWEDEFVDVGIQFASEVEQLRRQQGTARQGQDFFETLILWLSVLLAAEFLFASLSQNAVVKTGSKQRDLPTLRTSVGTEGEA